MSRLRRKALCLLASSILAAASAAQETVLYSFTSQNSDQDPPSGLVIDKEGNLYGTSSGAYLHSGNVFELSRKTDGTWSQTVLYTFPAANGDGNTPIGGVIFDAKGSLYGTTQYGGKYESGTAFQLTPKSDGTWDEKILHSFGVTDADGQRPEAGLVLDAKGNLYGTTYQGGEHSLGTVFELIQQSNGTWEEKVIWSFAGAPSDGDAPEAGLTIDGEGNLYGTTNVGGEFNLGGTVFELSPQAGGGWTEKVLYSFSPYVTAKDGFLPQSSVVLDAHGNIYGTTACGGKFGATNGAVFELAKGTDGTWTESLLHSFNGADSVPVGPDGAYPVAGLIFDSEGNLFGTTNFGGDGNGTVFELAPEAGGSWSERVVYPFKGDGGGRGDGWAPQAPLAADASGNLYGTTTNGGANYAGTVFEIANPDRTQAPLFTPAAASCTAPINVKITDGSSGAAIYYTTDGSNPTVSSTKYTTSPSPTRRPVRLSTSLPTAQCPRPLPSDTYPRSKSGLPKP